VHERELHVLTDFHTASQPARFSRANRAFVVSGTSLTARFMSIFGTIYETRFQDTSQHD
jgi:hypothetical protein